MRTSVGIITGGQFHGTSWSLQDEKTRGEAFIDGDVKAALNGEMWVTPEGRLVVRLPGLSDTDGLSALNRLRMRRSLYTHRWCRRKAPISRRSSG
jgi:hypothetical protein